MIKYPIIPVAQTLILSCLKFDFFDVVISPGSRNVPLAIGFASNKKFKCYSIVDERSAAFFALGLSQKSKKPTILICTSGSALLNYYPAVAEAYYSEIPLIILSEKLTNLSICIEPTHCYFERRYPRHFRQGSNHFQHQRLPSCCRCR